MYTVSGMVTGLLVLLEGVWDMTFVTLYTVYSAYKALSHMASFHTSSKALLIFYLLTEPFSHHPKLQSILSLTSSDFLKHGLDPWASPLLLAPCLAFQKSSLSV